MRIKEYDENCKIISRIPSFSGKTFVASASWDESMIKAFLEKKGAFLRKTISGKTDYLIVSSFIESKYKAVLEQSAKGHTIEIIYHDDFEKQMQEDKKNEETNNVLNMAEEQTTGVKQNGNRLIFDDFFSITLPSGISFIPEKEDEFAYLTGFCKSQNDAEGLELLIRPIDANKTGAVREILEMNMEEHGKAEEDECDFIMLFENTNVEVAAFIQVGVSSIEIACNINFFIRVEEHCYWFQAKYRNRGLFLAIALKQDVNDFCRIFDNIEFTNGKAPLRVTIDNDKLEKVICKIFGIDKESVLELGEHCSEDTPVNVNGDWIITVPAGYKYSTDKDIVGERPIVLGIDDGTLDLSAPFDSTLNFSVTTPLDDEIKLPGLPLDNPQMSTYVSQAKMLGDICIRNDTDLLINYTVGEIEHPTVGSTLCVSRGCILTKHNLYAFQMFDTTANTPNKAEANLKKLLLSISTPNENAERKEINEELLADALNKLHSLSSQMKANLEDMSAWAESEKARLEEEERKNESPNTGISNNSGTGIHAVSKSIYRQRVDNFMKEEEKVPDESHLTEAEKRKLEYEKGLRESEERKRKAMENLAARRGYYEEPSKKEGCYIATAVYGSYDAPEVKVLRRFRDDTLKRTSWGRLFIKIYYTLSPPIAGKLKNAKRINGFVKKLLDKWIDRLKNRI